MHKLFELLKPSVYEVVIYPLGALLLLLVLNGATIWQSLLHAVQTDPQTAQSIGVGFRGFLERYTTLSDPQVVNAAVWALTGGLGFMLTVALVAFIHTYQSDRIEPTFLERFGIRILALGSLVLLAALLSTIVLPICSKAFVRTALHLSSNWYNALEFVGSILLLAVCLYVAAVLCRLVVLRLRVFSTVIE
jgi:hypothetical protein